MILFHLLSSMVSCVTKKMKQMGGSRIGLFRDGNERGGMKMKSENSSLLVFIRALISVGRKRFSPHLSLFYIFWWRKHSIWQIGRR